MMRNNDNVSFTELAKGRLQESSAELIQTCVFREIGESSEATCAAFKYTKTSTSTRSIVCKSTYPDTM